MTQSVTSWLSERGLQRYADAFDAADIDLEILPDLTDGDLEKLGVTLGDRKRILRALKEGTSAPRASGTPAGRDEHGERRQLSFVFCDIVGSTELAGRLDPEDLRTTMKAYHDLCSDVVARHGGEVAQFLGDGVMVQFGFPRAHEDDAERAVRCALDLVSAVRELTFPGNLRLQTRAGIATGTEVVGDLVGTTRDRMSVVGSTPSLASRLQSVAEPETVVITTATRQLLADTFALTDLPKRPIKGVGDDVPLWRVDGERRGSSRFALHRGATTRFVGRDFEIGLLRDRARLAAASEGHVVLLVADAGVGKSRIIEEFLAEPFDGEKRWATIRLQCAPHYSASALQPMRDFIEDAAQIEPTDSMSERLAKLAAFNGGSPGAKAETVDALALLLGLDEAEQSPSARSLSVEQRKSFVFRSLHESIEELARHNPVRLVVEDLHWVDPTTLEWLTQLIETIANDRVLVVATARPEFESPWARYGHVTSLTIDRLERRAVEAMVSEIAASSSLPRDLFAEIVQRTDGVPLFVEELTRSIIESSTTGAAVATIPGSLRDALTARLDALSFDREVAQFGAIVGREFSLELLSAIGERSFDALRPSLDRILASGLVHRQGSSGTKFIFKHALVRDVAYESLLRPRRAELHLRAARALAERGAVAADSEPEIIAHHFEEAGRAADAIPYWRQAADNAIARSAYREASAHIRRAIALLDRLPSIEGALEIDLRNLAGVVYCVLEGGRSETARDAYERALALSRDLPENAATFTALCGACFCDYMSGRTPLAIERSKELLALAQRLGDPDLLLEAYHTSWAVCGSVGDVRGALDASERGMAIYDPERHHVHVTKFGNGHDSGVCGLGFGAQSLILSGRIAEARVWIEKLNALVARLDHPFTKCVGLQHAACAFNLLGQFEPALALARESLAIAEPRKFPMPLGFSSVIAGAALVGLGQRADGTAMLARVLDDPKNAVPANWRPLHQVSLALAEFESGELGVARERLERALATAADIGGCIAEPEIHIALARVIAADVDTARALEYVETAIAHARTSGALLLELRASVQRTLYVERSDEAMRSAWADLQRLIDRFAGADADCSDVRLARAAIATGVAEMARGQRSLLNER
jgi:class 3 adenylate cyclase/tetratricopeptide (TPR) repeat protein